MAKKWWRKKYGQSPKPFHEYSLAELIREMYVDLYWQREECMTELEQRDGDKTDLYRRLALLDDALDDDTEPKRLSSDPLLDKWDRELAEGKEIDLEEQWVG
jgi:hypothetical protein